mgnify:CR=1 FL=1
MKLLKLAKEYDVQVRDIKDKISHIVSDPSPNTDLSGEQESAIRALLDQSHSVELTAANVFTATEPTDEELASAALDGIIADYSNRLRGQAIANAWIEQRAGGEGNATDDPIIQKKIQVVLMLRKLGIPHATPQPAPSEPASGGGIESGLSLPPLVQSALEGAFPERMQRINSPLPNTNGREAPQLQGAK